MIQLLRDGRELEIPPRVKRIICQFFSPQLLRQLAAPKGKGKMTISWGGDDLTIEVTETIKPNPIDADRET